MEYQITNGDITYTVKQVGEYMFNLYNGNKKVKRIDPLNKEKETEFWSADAIGLFMKAMNAWIDDSKKEETYIVYQIKNIRDCNYAFRGWDENVERDFNLNDYEQVCHGFKSPYCTDEKMMNDLWIELNTPTTDGRHHRSMSVSDVIQIGDRFYYVDDFGFKDITKRVEK